MPTEENIFVSQGYVYGYTGQYRTCMSFSYCLGEDAKDLG
jgi:hypothetical protein